MMHVKKVENWQEFIFSYELSSRLEISLILRQWKRPVFELLDFRSWPLMVLGFLLGFGFCVEVESLPAEAHLTQTFA